MISLHLTSLWLSGILPDRAGDARNIAEDVRGIKINERQTFHRKSNSQINGVAHCPFLHYLVTLVIFAIYVSAAKG